MNGEKAITRTQFLKNAAKELLADGEPHSYGELVQFIRKRAEGTCLEGRIEVNNVWHSMRSLMEEPGSPYQKVKWGIYQKDPPQSMAAGPVLEPPDGLSEIYQIMDQAVSILDQFENCCSRVQEDTQLAGDERFAAIRQQIMQSLDTAVTGLSYWAAELEDLREKQESDLEHHRGLDGMSLSM